MKRKIINIDPEKCNGCGACIPDCPEGALQIIDGKARLISDLFCDGLGACIKGCPQGAITVNEREAEPYNEKRVMENIAAQGLPVIKAHLEHLINHNEKALYEEAVLYLKEKNIKAPGIEEPVTAESIKNKHASHACPGSMAAVINRDMRRPESVNDTEISSELRQWPVQLRLLNPNAPYFDNADLLISADCVPFAYGNFHQKFLAGKIVIMFCPKLDDHTDEYIEKMAAILQNHSIKSITVLTMEVPCCGGVNYILEQAIQKSGKNIPIENHTILINGNVE